MNKETLRQNLPVIIAITLPVLLVICIAFLTMMPSLGPKPAYDFLFIQEPTRSHYENSSCVMYTHYYDIVGTELVKKQFVTSVFDKKEIAEPCYGYSQIITREVPELFVYRTSHNSIYPISFELASKFVMQGKTISPDGYSVAKRMINRGVIELFGGNNNGVYISKKNQHVKIDLDQFNDVSYYDSNFSFISWIDPLLSPPSADGQSLQR